MFRMVKGWRMYKISCLHTYMEISQRRPIQMNGLLVEVDNSIDWSLNNSVWLTLVILRYFIPRKTMATIPTVKSIPLKKLQTSNFRWLELFWQSFVELTAEISVFMILSIVLHKSSEHPPAYEHSSSKQRLKENLLSRLGFSVNCSQKSTIRIFPQSIWVV